MIPKVKTYQITTDDGAKHYVDAPTKLLAKLNFRHAGNYDAIKRIGVYRQHGLDNMAGYRRKNRGRDSKR